MKLKIRDEKDDSCEVWLEEVSGDIRLIWRDEEGDELNIVTLRSDKTINLHTNSGFKLKK